MIDFSAKKIRLLFCVCVYFTFFCAATAQEGWKLIQQNNFKEATKAFRSTLATDSTDKSSLEGLLMMSDISGDEIELKKTAKRYMRLYGNDDFFLLFRNQLGMTDEEIIRCEKLSERVKISSRFNEADMEFFKRNFEKSREEYLNIIGFQGWYLSGPFENIEGSGHIICYPPETEYFDINAVFLNEKKTKLKWIKPMEINTGSGINFSSHLIKSNSGTYYATSFFNFPEDQKIQFRVTRKNPVKIWLDGFCILESNQAMNGEYDNEIISLWLQKGNHQLLVKSSTVPSYDFGSEKYEYDYPYFIEGDNNPTKDHTGDILLRITDTLGKAIKSIRSCEPFINAIKHYTIEKETYLVSNNISSELIYSKNEVFYQYLFYKTSENYFQTKNNEQHFVEYWKKNKNSALAKYLLFNVFMKNGKNEKAYELIRDLDYSQTPIFEILYRKLQGTDDDTDEERYIELLDSLEKFAEKNLKIIHKRIKYLEKKGMNADKEKYIKEKIKLLPEYEHNLKLYLKTNAEEQRKSDLREIKREEKKSYKKNIRLSEKIIRKYYDLNIYEELIEHNKLRHNKKEVIRLLNEQITTEPWKTEIYYEKAKYFFDLENYDSCLKWCEIACKINPWDENILALKADAWYEKNENEKALENYLLAKKTSEYTYNIDKKIERITGTSRYKKMFQNKTLKTILEEDVWKEKYANEESVILLYTRDFILNEENDMEQYQQFAVKILSDAGISKWLEYDFSFLGTITQAKIIKNNGAEIEPEEDNGYIVSKNLEAGDIIYLEGAWKDANNNGDLPGEFFGFAYFSFEGPIYYCKYEIAAPKGKKLSVKHHKLTDNLEKKSHDGFDFYKYEYYDLPKLIFEEAMIDKMDSWANIMISTMPDWSYMVDWYLKKTYRKLEPTYEIEQVLDSIILPEMDDREKVEAIYNYLTTHIKYSYVPFLQSNYIPKDPAQTLSSRIGDCKDVAALMICLLRKVGIESYFVLVKTNDYFHQDILPSNFFNHAIAGYYLKGELHFADMTTDYFPYYILPAMDVGACALVVKPGNKELIRLPKDNLNGEKNKADIQINTKLNEDRSAQLQVKANLKGSLGGELREKITQYGEEEKRNEILQLMGSNIFPNLSISNYNFENISEISQALKANFTFTAANFCDKISGLMIFRIPYMYSIHAHPAIYSTERINQLDLKNIVEPEGNIQRVEIDFPTGYELLEMPKDFFQESKFGSYRVTFKKTKEGLFVEKEQIFNQNILSAEDFNEFKAYYLSILDFDSGKFALIKKGKRISESH